MDPDQPPDGPRRARSAGAVPGTGRDAETDYSKVDAVEIQNGPADLNTGTPNPPVNPFTATAIAFYENLLASGRHVAAVGSSDSHQGGTADGILGSPIGRAATVVHASELSRAAIVAGVKADHTYVKLYGSDGPEIRMTGTSPGQPGCDLRRLSAGVGRKLQGHGDRGRPRRRQTGQLSDEAPAGRNRGRQRAGGRGRLQPHLSAEPPAGATRWRSFARTRPATGSRTTRARSGSTQTSPHVLGRRPP